MSTKQPPEASTDIEACRRHLKTRTGMMFGLFAALGWGGYLAAIRHGVAEGLSANDLAFIRYATAGLVLTPWLIFRWRSRWARIGLSKALVLVMLAGPPLVMFVAGGSRHAPFASGILVELAVLTVVCILLAKWWLNERLDGMRLAGLAVLTIRIIVVAGSVFYCGTAQTWMGVLMFAAAGCMFASFVVLVEKWQIEPLAATAVVSVTSLCIFAPYYFWFEGLGHLSGISVWMLAEQVVGQGLVAGIAALTAFSLCVRLLGIVRATLFPALTPAAAVLFGAGLTGELPTTVQAVFLALTAVGAMLLIATARLKDTTSLVGQK